MLPFERETDEQKREEEIKRFFFFFFNLAGYIFKIKYSLDMLQCSPYLKSYYSKSKKKFGDAKSVGGIFWGEQWLFSPKFGDSYSTGDALRQFMLELLLVFLAKLPLLENYMFS